MIGTAVMPRTTGAKLSQLATDETLNSLSIASLGQIELNSG